MGNGTRRASGSTARVTGTPAHQSAPALPSRVARSPTGSPGPGRLHSGVSFRCASDALATCIRARLASCRPGPHSTSAQVPSASSVATQAPKRTGRRRCAAQYAGSVASASVIQVPVTLDRNGTAGGRSGTLAISAVNSSRIGSIIGEWKACEVRSSLDLFLPPRLAANSSTSAVSPATTQVPGPLTVATESPAGSRSATADSSSVTASIEPAGSECMSRPRAATTRSASGRLSTPATVAATYSPMEWPSIAAGAAPARCQAAARAYSTVNRAGWV
ncbi:hypothetical protein B0E53_06633 [Micromonospora sp. MH33]|nr:hypothetical protein B0E53_06633 [Micromonospora sp. MH33]